MNKIKLKQTKIGMIPEDWEVSTLEKISLEITDGSHFSPKESSDGDKIIATVRDMEYDKFSFKQCKKILDDDFNKLVKDGCSPERGDILISKDGANCLDLIFVYDQDEKIVLLSSIAIVKLKANFNPQFYRYYLLSPIVQEIMRQSYVSGSAIPRIVLKDLKKVPVPIPTIEVQNKIANILYSLDKKIELNHKMTKTLEAIGKTIFRHWLIDFEFPNDEGKSYSSSGGEMINNVELRKEIPKGWTVKPIDEIANFLNGLALQKFPPKNKDECLPVIKIKELRQGITESSDKSSSNIPKEYVVNDGDVLFSWSGSLEVIIWTFGKGALNQHLFKVTSADYPKWFYYYWILQYLPEFRRIAEGKATTMGHIQRHHLTNSLVLVPDDSTLQLMDKILGSIIEKIIEINIESKNLSHIRNLSLPKLMSGRIKIPVDIKS